MIRCITETDSDYGIAWPTSVANTSATNSCPHGFGMELKISIKNDIHVLKNTNAIHFFVFLNL